MTALTSRRLPALVRAEQRQFRRNKTLIYMSTLLPVGLPLFTFFVAQRKSEPTTTLAMITFEIFALMGLLFVQYYSVLSMVTTRRSEGVLKRLRTGEARDWEILTAPAVPGAVLTVIGAVITAAVVYGFGTPAPVNPVAIVLAFVLGLLIFALLAYATSAMTKNAEAAQITSLPVMVLAMIGLGNIRALLPDRWASIAEWTPFAAVSDLIGLGTRGLVPTAPESATALTFAETFGAAGRPLATLCVWAALAYLLATRYFRWDDRG